MMRKTKFNYYLLACLMLITDNLFGQKPALNIVSFDRWSNVSGGSITNDGKYIRYTINNVPFGSRTLILQSTSGEWKTELLGVDQCSFTDDSRKAVYMKAQDTLCVLGLGTGKGEQFADVAYYRLFRQGQHEILAIHSLKNKLELRNLSTSKKLSFSNVGLYSLSADGKNMIIQRSVKDDAGQLIQAIDLVDILSGKVRSIWKGKQNPGSFIFDGAKKLAFTVAKTVNNNEGERRILLWKAGETQANFLDIETTKGTEKLLIDELTGFSKDGTRLFIKLKKLEPIKAKTGAIKVDVWSYTDPKLQSKQLFDLNSPLKGFYGAAAPQYNYAALIDMQSKQLIQLESEYEYAENLFNEQSDDWLVIKQNRGGYYGEDYWNNKSISSFFLVSTKNGARKTLKGGISNLSPDGRYALGFDEQTNLFSYELTTGVKHNLTAVLSLPAGGKGYDLPTNLKTYGLSVAGWHADSKSVLIYDKYDIWKLDPSGIRMPVNLTNGYGRKHKTIFRFIEDFNGTAISKNKQMVLAAFNTANKENGFYQINFSKKQDPQKLTMGPYAYYTPVKGMGAAPIVARDAGLYLVQRESAAESPNYFLTRDFRSFKQLSAVYPEKEYNWMRSELVNFKTVNGKDEQGALYKPENFDPTKKYPVIIHYYERKSDLLNTYHLPGAVSDEINIPWFVSHGYLVFTPDIHYIIGKPGESAYNSVVGAANHLKAYPFVDGSHLSIQGHSFGGYETNYIVTHTNIFAAAMSSSGFSNLISSYGATRNPGGENYFGQWAEVYQGRIGTTLWKSPDIYVNNSPIFSVDKVTTPLLMMNNIEDGIVNFSQGVEFFTALRRLGKRAWMLQYDGQKHTIGNQKAKLDYTIRMTQFFDHYLKGAPAPLWMLHGIPAKMKGIDDGLALDTTGATPGPGLLIEEKKEPLN